MNTDDELGPRLAAFVEAIPASDAPALSQATSGRRLRAPMAALFAGLMGVVVGASVVIAGPTLMGVPQGHEGAFNKGQPLYCSGLPGMTPPQAEEYLKDRGYTVRWQVEERPSGDWSVVDAPPATGYIEAALVEGSKVLVVVEVGPAARAANGLGCAS